MTVYIDAEIARAIQNVSEALKELDEKLAPENNAHGLYLGAVTLMTEDAVISTFWAQGPGTVMANMLTAEEQNGPLGQYLRAASKAAIHGRLPE